MCQAIPSPTRRQRFARALLKLCGWTVETPAPAAPKYVLVVAPHTSNWDFPWGYLGKTVLGLHVHWVGKHTLFRWPFGRLSRWLGGIPVDRRAQHNAIEQLAMVFEQREHLVLAITPEGTRGYTKNWKSGFYYTALAAKVPLALAYIDYERKAMGIDTPFHPSGDLDADMQRIREFYADKAGRYPEKAGEIVILPPNSRAPAQTQPVACAVQQPAESEEMR